MPPTPEQVYDVLEDFVVRLMNVAPTDGLDAMIDLDLSFTQARLVFQLAKTDAPMPIHVIARGLGLSDAATGRNVDQLLRLDVVERRESPDDRRVKLVSLTAAGERLAASHLDAKRAAMQHFVRSLPDHQRQHLHDALTEVLGSGTLPPRAIQGNTIQGNTIQGNTIQEEKAS